MKHIIIALALFLSLPALAGWDADIPGSSVYSMQDTDSTGWSSGVSLALDGTFTIGAYPPGWYKGDSTIVGRGKSVMTVNGQAVKVVVYKHADGAIYIHAATYTGRAYVKGELWNKARVMFISQDGSRFNLSAKGFQEAWTTMTRGQGI